jgi:GT2 family glycosyltransferase
LLKVYIVILNWNGWNDTIACLESVFRLNYLDFRVVVFDNGSQDGSFEQIVRWANGQILAEPVNPELFDLTSPPFPKPIPHIELTGEQAVSGAASHKAPLVLIRSDANLGYAGGNNVGLRYALSDPDCEFFWLLNNDTVVDPEALSALVTKALTDRRIGAVASICYFADAPSTVQAWAGVRVNLWMGSARSTTKPRRDQWFHALYGASLLVARVAVGDTGLLDEGFFLYWEETEFCIRLSKKGWRLAAAPASRILHRVNGSTGGNSVVLDRYFTASGLRIIHLHSPMPQIAMSLFLARRFTVRLLRFRFSNCKSVWAGIQDYLQMLPIVPKTS